MFLPSWGGPMSTNLYSKLLNAYPHLCCTLGTIPSATLNYATPPFWISHEIVLLTAYPHLSYKLRTILNIPTTIPNPGPARKLLFLSIPGTFELLQSGIQPQEST
eukprot:1140527-Pelagomonas_calceolata.AAC.2